MDKPPKKPALDRTKVTFAQAEGKAPLPSQLKPKELSSELRNALWNVVYGSLSECFMFDGIRGRPSMRDPWLHLCHDWHCSWLNQPMDEFRSIPEIWSETFKNIFFSRDYTDVFEFLQYVIRSGYKPHKFEAAVARALDKYGAAYKIVAAGPLTIMPISSDEETAAVELAFSRVVESKYAGARAHMTAAAEKLTKGDAAGSVRESISAVESVCKVIGEKPGGDLESALNAISKRKKINGQLRDGLSKLYVYTNTEKGIRHALLEESAQVDSTDALFMFGACASFISYLIGKSGLAPN